MRLDSGNRLAFAEVVHQHHVSLHEYEKYKNNYTTQFSILWGCRLSTHVDNNYGQGEHHVK